MISFQGKAQNMKYSRSVAPAADSMHLPQFYIFSHLFLFDLVC